MEMDEEEVAQDDANGALSPAGSSGRAGQGREFLCEGGHLGGRQAWTRSPA